MAITMVVNVCIELRTGVIFEFMAKHIIIMVCILVLVVLMLSSAIALRSQKDEVNKTRVPVGEDLKGLRSTLRKIHSITYKSNPQTLLCLTTHHHAFAILCVVSYIPILVAIPRWLFIASKDTKLQYCGGASDYKWSIPVIVIQFLTIAMGIFSIIYRWFSFMLHSRLEGLYNALPQDPAKEIEELKESIVLTFVNKTLSDLLMATKDKILDAISVTQMMLYVFTCCFFGLPLIVVTNLVVALFCTMVNDSEDSDYLYSGLAPSAGNLSTMAKKEWKRWGDTRKRDHPAQELIKLINNWRVSLSTAAVASTSASAFEISSCRFVNDFEAAARDYLKKNIAATLRSGEIDYEITPKSDYEHRCSCLTLLVLSGIIKEQKPSNYLSKESLMLGLNELFEIIYFVDQNCISAFSVRDHTKLVAAKQLWLGNLKNLSSRRPSEIYKEQADYHNEKYPRRSTVESLISASKRDDLVALEFLLLNNFITRRKESEPNDRLWPFLEECFVRMVCYMLVMLPSAIVKEITAYYLTEIDETRVKKALKFFYRLESLGDTIKWYWPKKVKSQENDARSNPHVLALLHGLEGQASVSDVINEEEEEEKEEEEKKNNCTEKGKKEIHEEEEEEIQIVLKK